MELERHRSRCTAYQCLTALLADATVPDGARDLYGRAQTRLRNLAGDEPWELFDDVAELRSRGALYLTARQVIGELIGLGTPWTDVYPVLADVVAGWEDEHVAPRTERQCDGVVQTVPLQLDHNLLYGIARTQLVGLAMSVPATGLTDYWLALQVLDSLHDPMCRPSAGPPVASCKSVHYAAARAAITALCAFDLDNRAVLSIRDVLDREWEHDADHATSGSALDRA